MKYSWPVMIIILRCFKFPEKAEKQPTENLRTVRVMVLLHGEKKQNGFCVAAETSEGSLYNLFHLLHTAPGDRVGAILLVQILSVTFVLAMTSASVGILTMRRCAFTQKLTI
jgi:hypothetical protein